MYLVIQNTTPIDSGLAIVTGNQMIVLVQATVLTVGINGRSEILEELPVRVITMQSGIEAARSLKNENVNSVISRWDLHDMADGRFVKSLRAAKPHIPTIVFVKSGNKQQEIAARSLGVSAVLGEDADDELFRDTVANVLGLKGAVSIKAISSAETTEELLRER
jgi:DNA-binding NarL/FixJ family response regulator